MLDYKELEKQGLAHGFSHVASLDCSTIELMSEVRAMCEKNTCHRYGKCWSCPPGCGSLEECQKIICCNFGNVLPDFRFLSDNGAINIADFIPERAYKFDNMRK